MLGIDRHRQADPGVPRDHGRRLHRRHGAEARQDRGAAPRLDQAAARTSTARSTQIVEGALEKIEHAGGTPSPYTCDKCGKPMVYRISKNGFFLACIGYPECSTHQARRQAGQADRPRGQRAQVPRLRPRDDQAPRPLRRVPRLLGLLGQEREGRAELRRSSTSTRRASRCRRSAADRDDGRVREVRQPAMLLRDSKRGPFLGCSQLPEVPQHEDDEEARGRRAQAGRGADPAAEGRRRQGPEMVAKILGENPAAAPAPTARPARSRPTSTATSAASR